MYIERQLQEKLDELSQGFPILSLTGPRQSGKTTLLRHVFSKLPYLNFEYPDVLELAQTDPRSFMDKYKGGAVFDEIQRYPELFSYLQVYSDENPDSRFVISGSQNFLMNQQISQTLAGRVALLRLLPFSAHELINAKVARIEDGSWDLILNGFYPRIYNQAPNLKIFYNSYIQTYLERDVALIRNITDTRSFRTFLRLLAGRAGQLLNMSALANDVGVGATTIKEWISVLETSYIIHLVQPFHKNYNKRISKSPKIYFVDTGLLCFLLNIHNREILESHPLIGAVFENFIISETLKYKWNRGDFDPIYYWRENNGKEIDLVLEHNNETYAIEIKSGRTFSLSYFKNLKTWLEISGSKPENNAVVYNGEHSMNTRSGALLQWHELESFLKNKIGL
ncbi:DUF4143 domain-containing protein [bacterium]|nr:DUF4143 domain-containing protein [bacterium]